jgi:hypothetical protein
MGGVVRYTDPKRVSPQGFAVWRIFSWRMQPFLRGLPTLSSPQTAD